MSLSRRISSCLQAAGFRGDRRDGLILLEGVLILLILALVFYDTPAAVVFLSPLLWPIYIRSRKNDTLRRRQKLVLEFKDCTDAVLTSMKAGSSAENAFRSAEEEMAFFYGPDSEICRELELLTRGLDSNVPLEELLQEFARRSGAEEIEDFADVFAIAKRSGGNMSELLTRTISQIQNRIDVEREIRVITSNSLLEQQIMDVVPIGIIAYMRLTSEGFMDPLYGNPAGTMIMTICLAVYLAAYFMSEKIADIRV